MSKHLIALITITVFLGQNVIVAQDAPVSERYQVAIFAPLYLDSAFDESGDYQYGKNVPKFLLPGLEFYEGIQLAIDSLKQEGLPLDIKIFDVRSASNSIAALYAGHKLDSVDLIIGQVTGAEAKSLAGIAALINAPFINASYPNDAGVKNNPNFVILNSTLHTHCVAIYKFIQKTYPLAEVVFFRKKGTQEDRLRNYFDEISKTTSSVPLKIKYVVLEDAFTPDDLEKYLADGGTTICIAGSLDLSFGQVLTEQLASLLEKHPSIVMGMPNWGDITDFASPEYKGIETYYTTPFYAVPDQPLVTSIQQYFKTKYYSKPTDLVFRGYETLYHFAHLLALNGKNLSSSLADKRFKLITDFDIQPVLDQKTMTLNYFENKKIYLIKRVDGAVTGVF